jgi:ubiquitin-protein ligase
MCENLCAPFFLIVYLNFFVSTLTLSHSHTLHVMCADIASLDAGRIAEATFPNPQDLTNFLVVVSPDEGFWSGARYEFSFSIPPTYPHDPPKVHCNTKIFHPNINLEGTHVECCLFL